MRERKGEGVSSGMQADDRRFPAPSRSRHASQSRCIPGHWDGTRVIRPAPSSSPPRGGRRMDPEPVPLNPIRPPDVADAPVGPLQWGRRPSPTRMPSSRPKWSGAGRVSSAGHGCARRRGPPAATRRPEGRSLVRGGARGRRIPLARSLCGRETGRVAVSSEAVGHPAEPRCPKFLSHSPPLHMTAEFASAVIF